MTSHGKDKPRTLFSFVLSFQFRVQFRSESFYYIKAAACPLCIMFENGQNRITARWPSTVYYVKIGILTKKNNF